MICSGYWLASVGAKSSGSISIHRACPSLQPVSMLIQAINGMRRPLPILSGVFYNNGKKLQTGRQVQLLSFCRGRCNQQMALTRLGKYRVSTRKFGTSMLLQQCTILHRDFHQRFGSPASLLFKACFPRVSFIMPFARSVNALLRTSRLAAQSSQSVNPVNLAFGQNRVAARTYAAAFQRTKPHVNVGM